MTSEEPEEHEEIVSAPIPSILSSTAGAKLKPHEAGLCFHPRQQGVRGILYVMVARHSRSFVNKHGKALAHLVEEEEEEEE